MVRKGRRAKKSKNKATVALAAYIAWVSYCRIASISTDASYEPRLLPFSPPPPLSFPAAPFNSL